jgi:hypothetical protein
MSDMHVLVLRWEEHVTRISQAKNTINILLGNVKGKEHLKATDVNERIVVNYVQSCLLGYTAV